MPTEPFVTVPSEQLSHATGGSFVCRIAGQRAGEEAAKHYAPAQAAKVRSAYASAVQSTCERLQRKGVSPNLF